MAKGPCTFTAVGGMILAIVLAACNRAESATGTPVTNTETAAATATACVLDAELQDRSAMQFNIRFGEPLNVQVKLTMKNNGTCPWPDGAQFVYYRGDIMGSNHSVGVRPLPAGESTVITLYFSPRGYNTYHTTWRLTAPDGTTIGEPYPIDIVIQEATEAPRSAAYASPIFEATPTSAWQDYRQGDEGPAVTAIQYLLRAEGYTLEADGVFGPLTEDAVSRFQVALGLPPDGIVDAKSWSALVVRHQLEKGARGDAVKALQYLLSHVHGYDLLVDGDFGSDTRAAVIDFQSEHLLWFVDGIVGESTWDALLPDN